MFNLLAPLIKGRKGEYKKEISEIIKKGLKKCKNNIDKIYNFLLGKDIKLYLVIWPAPDQIYFNDKNSKHRIYWKNWSNEKKIKLLDLNEFFFEHDYIKRNETIEKYYISGDTHWNKNGHELIYKYISKEISKNNF